MQSYNKKSYFQTFFNFFCFWRVDLPIITNFVFMLCLCSSLFRWSCVPVVCWSCVRWSPDNHTHAHTYARIYARARGFLDSNF